VRSVDVLVIGAGLGGLAAGSSLARAGLDVLVLEAGEHPGGYATGFDRGDYSFDASLHLLDAVGPGEANRPIWEALDLHKRVTLRRPEHVRRELWPQHRIDVPHALDDWTELLSREFPSDREGFFELARLARRVHQNFVRDRDARLGTQLVPMMDPDSHGLLEQTADQLLRGLLEGHAARAVAGSLSCFLGLPPTQLGAISFLSMLASYGDGGSYPVGGSRSISSALVDLLVESGGALRVNAEVTEIQAVRRTARGVRLASGEQIQARYVVSNASPLHVFGTMLPRDQVEGRFLRRLRSMTLGTSAVKVWLGLDVDPRTLGLLAYETFLRASYTMGLLQPPGDFSVVAPHLLDPGCCPPGHGVLSLTAGVWAEAPPPGQEQEAVKDREAANALADELIEHLDRRLLPGLSDHVVVRTVATPSTFQRYSGSPGGSIHGFGSTPTQSGPRRMGVRTPVGGLFQVGAWVYAGSGFVPSLLSGLIAARAIETDRDRTL
jgi:all-trans-retinol 13,14-reductase